MLDKDTQIQKFDDHKIVLVQKVKCSKFTVVVNYFKTLILVKN